MIQKNLTTILFLISAIFLTTIAASAQTAQTNKSWLDQPLKSWNRTGNNFPTLPRPAAVTDDATMLKRCYEQIRQPSNLAEEAVAKMGWKLYGASQRYGTTQIFTALSGFDGMCRPVGYQAFVYWEGRYAGTLSPAAMDSRSDGALTDFSLNSPTNISAEFVRYNQTDALCCPSRISNVFYELKRDDIPDLVPTLVETNATVQPDNQTNDNSNMNSLFGKRWTLTKIGNQNLSSDKPFIEFNKDEKRISGDAGCNLFSGGFEMNGASLKFSNIAGTLMACADETANRLERNFLQSLGDVTEFEIEGDTLRLFLKNKPNLIFRAKNPENKTASVTGTVSYLPRIALAPNAVIKIQLLDVSKADAKSQTIAEQTINAEGRQVPFDFELKYDPNKINQRNRYALRAQIYENGKLRFTSTKSYQVITNGNPDKAEIIVDLAR